MKVSMQLEDVHLTMADYEETSQAEMTSRLMQPHEEDLTEWYGYGTIAGLAARATYYTTEEDAQMVDDNGGDWGAIDWTQSLAYVQIVTDDGVPVVTIYNPDNANT